MREMKAAVGVILLGAMLASSAYAAEPAAPAATSLRKDMPVQSASSATKKSKSLQGKMAKSPEKAGKNKAGLNAKKLDSASGTAPEAADESVQLRGVRG